MELSSPSQQPILQPLTVGQLLDRSFRLYRRHFLTFVGIAAAVQIPYALIQAFASTLQQDPSGALQCLGLILILLGSFVVTIGQGALARAAGMSYLGQATSFSDAYGYLRDRWLSLVGMQILLVIIAIAILVGSAIALVVGWLSWLGMIIFFFAVISPLAVVVLILEDQGAADSIGRSWDIARQRFWWILGYMFVLGLLSLLVVAGPAALIAFVGISTIGLEQGPLVLGLLQAVSNGFLGILYLPLQTIAITVMYIDFRVRYEGFDLALQAEEGSEYPKTPAQVLRKVSPATPQRVITWGEWGNFVGISFAIFALWLALLFLLAGLGFLLAGI